MQKLETELEDRVLRFDGVSIVEPADVYNLLLCGVPPSRILVTKSTEEIESFNYQVVEDDKIREQKEAPISITAEWKHPEHIQNLNIEEYVAKKFEDFLQTANYTDDQVTLALNRISDELAEISTRGLEQFLKTAIYIVETFRSQGQVWGVGRGSSCASYILFLIGIHVVDCVKYNIDMLEFFHD